MTSTSHHLLAAVAIVALAAAPASAAAADHGPVVRSSGALADLQPAASSPFDGATAAFQLVEAARGSHAVLRVSGIGAEADGQTFGAHLHVGPCVAGNGAAALGHYNTDVLAGVTPPEVSERTEVWLDLAVDDGAATATASVPFVPLPGARSVVVHALATDSHTGTAGARLACLPVVW
jgi:superoxide dismutase, Cu-Zn family